MSQIDRLYWLDEEIRSKRCPNPRSVCREFGVAERTAYDDVAHMKKYLNAPIDFDHDRGGWVYTDPTYMLPFLALTEKQAASLRRSLLAAREYATPADAEPMRVLAERLGEYAPAVVTPGRESVRGSLHLARALSADLVDACQRAVERRHRLHMQYYVPSRDELTERTIRPHDLLNWRGELHLIAFCELRQEIRQFFLGCVRQWELLEPDAAFARVAGFDVDAYLARGLDLRHGDTLVTVRARFSPYQARWIRERRYHESQETEELPDGSLLLSLRVAGTEEVRRWLLGYGAEVEVLEPASLRAEIATAAKKLSEIYAG